MNFDVGDRVRYTRDKIERADWDHITYGHVDLDMVVRRVEGDHLRCQHADSPVDVPFSECMVVLAADVEQVFTDWIGAIAAPEDDVDVLRARGVRTGTWIDGRFEGCALDDAVLKRIEGEWGRWVWSLRPADEMVREDFG